MNRELSPGRTRPTLREVASLAGVSIKTASRVVNHESGVMPAKVRAVRQAVEELDYRPNSLARGLRLQRSNILALVSDEIATTPYAGQMILGAQEAASRHGWLLMLVNSGGDVEVEAAEIAALRQRQVDGFLYATMYHRRVEVAEPLRGVPTVLLDASADDPSYPSVVPDERHGGYTATRALLDAGHTQVALVNNVDDIPATRLRREGYDAALGEAGLGVDEGLVLVEESLAAGGYRAGGVLLDRDPRPTAIFCFNDRMAMGVYQAAAERGLRIPEDLSVVGFDNQELIADGLRPGLTTVALPHYEMGAWAVDALIGRIKEPETTAEQALLRCPLVERGSVAAPPA